MANWPFYSIEISGEPSSVENIERMLRDQTRGVHVRIHTDYDEMFTEMIISGETPWGIKGFGEIVRIVEENKMDFYVYQGDIQADTKIRGRWKEGKEVEWVEEEYFEGREFYSCEETEEKDDYTPPGMDEEIPF